MDPKHHADYTGQYQLCGGNQGNICPYMMSGSRNEGNTENITEVWKSTFQFFCNKEVCPCAYVRPGSQKATKSSSVGSGVGDMLEHNKGNLNSLENKVFFVDKLLEKSDRNEIKVSIPGGGLLFKVPMMCPDVNADRSIMHPKKCDSELAMIAKKDEYRPEKAKNSALINTKDLPISIISPIREKHSLQNASAKLPTFPKTCSQKSEIPNEKETLSLNLNGDTDDEIQIIEIREVAPKKNVKRMNAKTKPRKRNTSGKKFETKSKEDKISKSEKLRSREESMRKIREKREAWEMLTLGNLKKRMIGKVKQEAQSKSEESIREKEVVTVTAPQPSENHIQENETTLMNELDYDYEELIIKEMLQEVILDFPLLSPPPSPEPEPDVGLAVNLALYEHREMTPTYENRIMEQQQQQHANNILFNQFLLDANFFQKSWNFNKLGPYAHLNNHAVKSPALSGNPFHLPVTVYDTFDRRRYEGWNEPMTKNTYNFQPKTMVNQTGELKFKKAIEKTYQSQTQNQSDKEAIAKRISTPAEPSKSKDPRDSITGQLVKSRVVKTAKKLEKNKIWTADYDYRVLPPTKRKIVEDLNKIYVLGGERCETKALLKKRVVRAHSK